MRSILRLLQKTLVAYLEDGAQEMAAALAYYSLLSIGPLLLIAVVIASVIFEKDAAQGLIIANLQQLIGRPGSEAIQQIMLRSYESSSNILAAAAGIFMLFLGASAVFGQLQHALNVLWKAPAATGQPVIHIIKNRLLSFAMVVGIGFLLMLSLVMSAALTAIGGYFPDTASLYTPLLELLNSAGGFTVTTVLFAMMFKILPDVHIRWRDVWGGAALASALFTAGRFLIGYYLGSSAISSAYGAAGSIVVLALWVHYSALIFFFGAKLTYVYAHHKNPAENIP